jgi:hypothetical protein
MRMVRHRTQKQFRLPVACLALAAMGVFIFVSLDSVCFDDFRGTEPARSIFFTAVDSPLDCLEISGIKDAGFSPSRIPLRITALPDLVAGTGPLCASAIKSITKTIPETIKTVIPLKLRI